MLTLPLLAISIVAAAPLAPGDHVRTLEVGDRARTYLVHVPPQYEPGSPVPIVLAFHGALTNGPLMAAMSGLSEKADEAGFVVVYPNGRGKSKFFLTWNAGTDARAGTNDDVTFVRRLLDDLETVINIDSTRVLATGHSVGGAMCYLLATEMPERIAAIAPIAAVMAGDCQPKRPVPVMHFHGTNDGRVPFDAADSGNLQRQGFRPVAETVKLWARVNRCRPTPTITQLRDTVDDGTTVKRLCYAPRPNGAEVFLYVIEGGGHTWPGRAPLTPVSGKSTMDISANDLIWDFFERYSNGSRGEQRQGLSERP